ncbi:large conductance mechanosensitive channel protein MscL [Rothia sp. AR01]|uniref:Large-conductance mechanosensitive channel n=1 Tax=Rothia santali TaxID=2949643 RepID=A0A9X2KGI5_9MICC|nr:large conductance mechanosensitive channel protein MscL [Rothia santali]MCP3424897.1 large conductance mechanosensitive channel protein MscL [Rothia santali]
MLQGFRDFITRGNVLELAVAVILGGAFNTVVNALVESVIMPAVSWAVGAPSFDSFLVFGPVRVGVLLTAVVNFLIVAAAIYFCIVLPINKLNERRRRRLGLQSEEEGDPQVALLTEIRDALVARDGSPGPGAREER